MLVKNRFRVRVKVSLRDGFIKSMVGLNSGSRVRVRVRLRVRVSARFRVRVSIRQK